MALSQTIVTTTHPIRNARAIHRAIEHQHRVIDGLADPPRTLWAQPAPHTIVIRTPHLTRWTWPHATSISHTLVPDTHPQGARIAWALIANPTRSIHPGNAPDGTPLRRGARRGITCPEHAEQWARDRVAPAITTTSVTATPMPSARGGDGLTLTRWAYAGHGTVSDPQALAVLLRQGVGRGKAFGCGLLIIRETP